MTCRPQHRCHGHTSEGYGISWNPIEAGHLLSASADHTICLWNTNVPEVDISPLLVFKGHSKGVEDVDWNKHQPTIFASVGDDSSLLLWDCRQGSASVLKTVTNAHTYGTSGSSSSGSSSSTGASQGCDVNCVSFNPFDEFTLATGGSDGSVKIWDTRNLSEAMHQCIGHKAGKSLPLYILHITC